MNRRTPSLREEVLGAGTTVPVVARVGTDRRVAGERFSDRHIDRYMPEMPECVLNVHIYVRHLPEKNLGVPKTLPAPNFKSHTIFK